MEANFRGAFDLSKLANQNEEKNNDISKNAVSDQNKQTFAGEGFVNQQKSHSGNNAQPVAQHTPAQQVLHTQHQTQGSSFGIAEDPSVPTSLDIDDTLLEVAVGQSTKYPIILLIWSAQFEHSTDFNSTFDKVAAKYNGRFQLLKVNIDENPMTQKVFKVETVPYVIALINGGMAPLFTGKMEEADLCDVVDKVLAACMENGVVGTAQYLPSVQVEVPKEHTEAMEAFEKGDYEAAKAAWELALRKDPKDHTAKVGLADLRLRQRVDSETDFDKAVSEAMNAGDEDFDIKFRGADAMLVLGKVQQALDTLLSIVLHGDEQTQDEARKRLIDAFDMLGPIDEVVRARRTLASYLS